MGRRCGVCAHQQADAINDMLASGRTLREIVARFPELSRSGLHRHKAHVSTLLIQAKQAADTAAGQDILGGALAKLAAIEAEARRLAGVAEEKGNLRVAADLLVNQAVRLTELTAKLKGLLQPGGVNVAVDVTVNSPEDVAALPPGLRRAVWQGVVQILNLLPPELRQQALDCLRQDRRAQLQAETRRIAAELDAREPGHVFLPAPPTVNGEGNIRLLGDDDTTIRPDGDDTRARLLGFAGACGWPHLVLRAGLVIAQETGWRAFASTGDAADVGRALVALEAVQPP